MTEKLMNERVLKVLPAIVSTLPLAEKWASDKPP